LFDVFFTDIHLNPLGSLSTFGAKSVAGNVSASLSDPFHTADQLPVSFRMLYCGDPSALVTCHDGPADQGCVTSPCFLKTEVGRWFLYGNPATLSVTGQRVGSDVVQVWGAVDDVAVVYELPGTCGP
jgi:hypothetical protein